MKKTFSKLWVFSLIFIFASCGENLSFKEGASQSVVGAFLKTVEEGDKEKALKFVLDRFKKDADIIKFINSKVTNIGQLSSEVSSVHRNVLVAIGRFHDEQKELKAQFDELKEKLKDIAKPEKEDVDKMVEIDLRLKKIQAELNKITKLGENHQLIVDILKAKLQPGFERMAKETFFLVKMEVDGKEDSYVIFYFSAQNVNHITGIYPVDIEKSSLLYYSSNETLQKDLYNLLIENTK